ncbi:MAG: DnaJ domain-containing protein [Gammaproteobacteria bacterium]|nr:MAG: DnaJ domain-containing protein [Gammaproteobacteria bacterium]
MQFKDYYQVLGVSRDAGQDDIKRAYRKLARKYHPDVSKETDAEARFKELGEAYEVLKDPEKRAAYDQFGGQWQAGQEFRPPPDWDAGFEFRGGLGGAGFSDFFESLFGGAGPFAAAGQPGAGRSELRAKGEDHHAKILISLEDAYRGGSRSVRLQMPELDTHGQVALTQRTLNVSIPKGIVAGQQIRLTGQGAPGLGGGPAGDLYLEIEFQPHRRFRAEGRDIYAILPVTPWEAALGARIPVLTLGGAVEVSVPAGAQSGQKLRLKGRGLPGQPGGDHYVELRMVTPPAKDAGARELYQRMAEQFRFDPRRETTAS